MTPMMCMAVAMFFEARNQGFEGKIAIGDVIMTRVEDSRWPDNVCGVVYDDKAFSFTHDGLSDDPMVHTGHQDKIAWELSKGLAEMIMTENNDVSIEATHFHTDYVDPWWSNSEKMEFVGQIGNHLFYIES